MTWFLTATQFNSLSILIIMANLFEGLGGLAPGAHNSGWGNLGKSVV